MTRSAAVAGSASDNPEGCPRSCRHCRNNDSSARNVEISCLPAQAPRKWSQREGKQEKLGGRGLGGACTTIVRGEVGRGGGEVSLTPAVSALQAPVGFYTPARFVTRRSC